MTVGEYFARFFSGVKGMTTIAVVVGFGLMLSDANRTLGLFAAFRPEDLLFHHRHIDHMKMVVVDLPTNASVMARLISSACMTAERIYCSPPTTRTAAL